jgi:biotin carboxylase
MPARPLTWIASARAPAPPGAGSRPRARAPTTAAGHGWPQGYGFLSENAGFVDICADHGLEFIGPKSNQIRVMGDKSTARDTMKVRGSCRAAGAVLSAARVAGTGCVRAAGCTAAG